MASNWILQRFRPTWFLIAAEFIVGFSTSAWNDRPTCSECTGFDYGDQWYASGIACRVERCGTRFLRSDDKLPSISSVCNTTSNDTTDLGLESFSGGDNRRQDILRKRSMPAIVLSGSDLESRCLQIFISRNSIEPFGVKAHDLRDFVRLTADVTSLSGFLASDSNLTSIEAAAFEEFKSSLTDVDLSRNNIDRMTWKVFDNLERLDYLNLSGNRLVALDCQRQAPCRINSTVRTLDVSGNLLTRFPTVGGDDVSFRRLSVLNVSNNRISTLSWDLPETLREFDVSGNQLSVLETGVFTSRLQFLEIVDLSRNRLKCIRNLTFADLSGVRVINISHNEIESIEAAGFHSSSATELADRQSGRFLQLANGDPASLCDGVAWPLLRTLDLSYNKLRSIEDSVFVGALCGVRELLLGNNRIGRLSRYIMEQLRRLEVLDLQHNELTWLEVGTFTSPSLRHINLSHNELRKLISMTFLYLPTVTEIDLSYNDIGYLYRYAFYRICKDSNQHIRISLRGNRLQTDAVWKMLSLMENQENSTCRVDADLRDNQVTHLMGIEAIQALKNQFKIGDLTRFSFWERLTIKLEGNPVECDCQLADEINAVSYVAGTFNTSLSSRNLASWTYLNCSQPAVFQGFSVSEFLAYSICPLQISYSSCPDYCDCRFDVRGKGNRYINCSRRHLSNFPNFESVYFNAVDLSYNELTSIPVSYLRSATHVVYLDLSHNHLKTLPGDALAQMSSLKQLFLHQNDLQYLPADIATLPRLKYLSIQGNPLSCDCQHTSVSLIATKLRGTVSDFRLARCADGRFLSHLNLTLSSVCSSPSNITDISPKVQNIVLVLGVVVISVCLAGFALSRLHRNAFRRSKGPWMKVNTGKREDATWHDIFISYCDWDEAWVTGTLLDIIWNESSNYSVYLQQQQQQQQPDELESGAQLESDTIGRQVESSKVTIVVLSNRFLKTIWATDSYRARMLEKLESQRHLFIFICLEQVDVEEQDIDLHRFMPEDKTLHVTDSSFADKLIYHLPPPLKQSRISQPPVDSYGGLLVELTDSVSSDYNREKY